MSWSDKIQVKKGDIGEEIVKKYLQNRGWIIYKPITDGAHPFDMFCSRNKTEFMALDVKTKARLNNWAATGIDIRHYNDYKTLTETLDIDFYLFFVDDKVGTVHCQQLSKLPEPFKVTKYIYAWNLEDMIYLFTISDEEIKKISNFDSRNYDYKPNN